MVVHRLERLQRIVSKVQMESGVCEEQLNQVESLLQTVSRQRSLDAELRRAGEAKRWSEPCRGCSRERGRSTDLVICIEMDS